MIFGFYLNLGGVMADQERVVAEAVERLLALARRRADDGDRHPERLGELDGHVDVAEAPEADDAEVLAWLVERVLHHRAVHRDAGAAPSGGRLSGTRTT